MASEQSLSTETPETPEVVAGADLSAPDEGVNAEAEAKASKAGWRSKEEFVARGGKESDWVPADEFLRIRETLSSFRSKENKRLERALQTQAEENAKLQKRLDDMERAFAEQNQARSEVQENALWARRESAIAEGNAAEVNKIDRQLADLRRAAPPAPPAAPKGQQGVDPATAAILEDFTDDHPEYKEPKMQALLARAAMIVAQSDPGLRGRDLLDDAHDTARRLWSDRYTTTAATRRAPAMAETGGAPARATSNVKTWADLKPEARQALENFIKNSETHRKMKPEDAKASILKNVPPENFKSR